MLYSKGEEKDNHETYYKDADYNTLHNTSRWGRNLDDLFKNL